MNIRAIIATIFVVLVMIIFTVILTNTLRKILDISTAKFFESNRLIVDALLTPHTQILLIIIFGVLVYKLFEKKFSH